jgi:T-Q ester bond containing domain
MFFKSWLGSNGARSLRALVTCALPFAALLGGCTVTPNSTGTGSLAVSWTLESSSDPNQCSALGAQSISIKVSDLSGNQVASVTESCAALSTTIDDLPEGSYTMQAQLLDANAKGVTSILGPTPEAITAGQTTPQAIDFPEDSFGPGTTTANDGSLDLTWTVASSTDCSVANATNIVLQLFDSNNTAVGSAQTAACSALSATLPDVAPGSYTLTAKLVDTNGADATTTVPVPVVITAGTTTTQAIDFPRDSFETSASGTGSIDVTWTITSGTSATSCESHEAASISLQLYDADGTTAVGDPILASCVAFETSITNLPPGSYTLSAQLVNDTGSVSSLIPPQPVTVTSGASAPEAFDFPSDSF